MNYDRPTIADNYERNAWARAFAKLAVPEIRQRCGLRIDGYNAQVSDTALMGQHHIGECGHGGYERARITITDSLHDARAVAAVIVHELIHAGMPAASHGWAFQEAGSRLGLTIDNKGFQEETPAFWDWIDPLLARLSSYPAGASRPALVKSPIWWPALMACACLFCFITLKLKTSYTVAATFHLLPAGEVLTALSLAPVVTPLLYLGLANPSLAMRPQQRVTTQIILAAAPYAAFLVVMGLLYGLPVLQTSYAEWLATGVDGFHARIGMAGAWPHGLTGTIGKAIDAGAILASNAALIFVSLPLALWLWSTRPFAPNYDMNGFQAPTPPFLLQQRQVPGDPGIKFNRSKPDDLGRVLVALEYGARYERAKRGVMTGDLEDKAYRCELVPASGFLIDTIGSDGLYACEVIGRPNSREKEQAASIGFNKPVKVRLIQARLPDHLLPPSSQTRRGATFAYPQG